MAVAVHPDPTLRRVIVTVPPGSPWRHMEAAILNAVERSPNLTDWNWIIDDQGPVDDVAVEGMARIGAAFRRLMSDPAARTHTIVVTTDSFFGPWARVMDQHYGNRRHHAAPSLPAAVKLLDRLEAASPPPPPAQKS